MVGQNEYKTRELSSAGAEAVARRHCPRRHYDIHPAAGQDIVYAVKGGATCYVSVSAGCIADTGRDPVPLMADAVEWLKEAPNARDHCANEFLKRLSLVGKDMDDYSLET
jgi:hypothetical protein